MILSELIAIARNLSFDYEGYERLDDYLGQFKFRSRFFNWADLQIMEERFGDSLWNYLVTPHSEISSCVLLVVIVKPSAFV